MTFHSNKKTSYQIPFIPKGIKNFVPGTKYERVAMPLPRWMEGRGDGRETTHIRDARAYALIGYHGIDLKHANYDVR